MMYQSLGMSSQIASVWFVLMRISGRGSTLKIINRGERLHHSGICGMYGVILWNDIETGNALIWCEDHCGVAYLEAPQPSAGAPCNGFETGDFVEFELAETPQSRRAVNAQMVGAPDVTGVSHLKHYQSDASRRTNPRPETESARVVNLSDFHRPIVIEPDPAVIRPG